MDLAFLLSGAVPPLNVAPVSHVLRECTKSGQNSLFPQTCEKCDMSMQGCSDVVRASLVYQYPGRVGGQEVSTLLFNRGKPL